MENLFCFIMEIVQEYTQKLSQPTRTKTLNNKINVSSTKRSNQHHFTFSSTTTNYLQASARRGCWAKKKTSEDVPVFCLH